MLTKTTEQEPIAPADAEQTALAALDRLVHESEAGDLRLVGPAGQTIELTESTMRVLRQAIGALAENRVVTISQLPKELPSYAAADLLGMTHARFLELLDQGAIPASSREGAPRVRFEDVMDYKRARDVERRRILDEMAQESQELESMMRAVR